MPTTEALSPLEAVNEIRNNNDGQVVLVLQGGGALGAYQGGVYQALHEAGVEPDWLIGTSHGGDLAPPLKKQSWLNLFVALGAAAAAVMLLVWANSCASGA